MNYIYIILVLFFVSACSIKPKGMFESPETESFDYSQLDLWAAHPEKLDYSDSLASGLHIDSSLIDKIDIFFIHPTSYTGTRRQNHWNGPVNDEKLNNKTDEGAILYQASAFNGAGRIFAPRYRQAHYHAYFTRDKTSAKKALDLAYSDVRSSFEYYLENYNEGRGIIIASHSQGTTHAARLLREFFDGQALSSHLVAAYLLGLPVPEEFFDKIEPCKDPSDIHCFCSWRTWERDHKPKKVESKEILVTNPLSWRTDSQYVPHSSHSGALIGSFEKGVISEFTDAQVSGQVLWVTKPKFPGSVLIRTHNFHRGDVNIFYVNIRENAILRSRYYLNQD